MSYAVYSQLIATATGALLLTAVLQVWSRSLRRGILLLSVQGVALAGLACTIGIAAGEPQVFAVTAVVLIIKGAVMPWAMLRAARSVDESRERRALVGAGVELLGAAALTAFAFLVSAPLVTGTDPAVRAVPVGVAMLLLGMLVLVTRGSAISQLVGFGMVDNGIATVAFLISGGLPLMVELGVSLDVLLVVLILGVLVVRMRAVAGTVDVTTLNELAD